MKTLILLALVWALAGCHVASAQRGSEVAGQPTLFSVGRSEEQQLMLLMRLRSTTELVLQLVNRSNESITLRHVESSISVDRVWADGSVYFGGLPSEDVSISDVELKPHASITFVIPIEDPLLDNPDEALMNVFLSMLAGSQSRPWRAVTIETSMAFNGPAIVRPLPASTQPTLE